MNFYFLIALALTPFAAVGFWILVGVALGMLSVVICAIEWGVTKLTPPAPPSCDIDPRCHPAFVMLRDGRAFIGKHEIKGLP